QGYKPTQVFEWWQAHIRGIQPGRYRVIVLDTITEVENGLVEWVRSHPQEFGHTQAQYAKMSALMWGDTKQHWKALLTDLATRCQKLVFVSHTASVWAGDRPRGNRRPRAKETLMQLPSLYLVMERKPDKSGKVPDKPSATVLKSRLASVRTSASGEIEIVP